MLTSFLFGKSQAVAATVAWLAVTTGRRPTTFPFYSLGEALRTLLRSAEFSALYGTGASNESLVGLLYRNVLINFSESAENKVNVIGVIQNGIVLEP